MNYFFIIMYTLSTAILAVKFNNLIRHCSKMTPQELDRAPRIHQVIGDIIKLL